jgi:RNA polymerase sigma factor (sigma-70 family)
MELVQFKTRCRKCHKKLRITLDQARADQSMTCPRGHTIQARAAIENELINGVNQGSRYYFECLVEIFDREVRGIVQRSLERWLRPDLASLETDDAVQELYSDLWQKGIRVIDKTLTAYLRGVAYYKGIDRMRERHDSLTEPLDDDPRSATSELPAEDLLLTLERAEQLEMVAQAFSTLPTDQQEVYRLRRIEGWPEAEVANFQSRLNRAETAIRKSLSNAAPVRSV